MADLALWPGLHPKHWPISRKVAAGPVMIITLLGMVMVFGWSMAERHQHVLIENYKKHSVYEQTALRLPRLLADIQKELYKLTIWAQLDVKGTEITVTEDWIKRALGDVGDMVAMLEEQQAVEPLKDAIRRYGQGVEQALILIQRSPEVGATATRGIDRVYRDADRAAEAIAASTRELFEQSIQQTLKSWEDLVASFFLMLGAVGLLVPVLAITSNSMIAAPIRNLARIVDRFRSGDLDVQVAWTRRRDEIGLVARAMESFRESLIRNQILEHEREQLNQELERKVEDRTRELERQKERLAKALEKEHHLNGLQRQFVAMVCHEFRTPLSIIDGNAQRLIKRRDTITPDRIESALGKVRTAVSRLIELMESVLSASRLEAGTIKMEPAPSDLAEMITEVAGNHGEVNPSHKITTDVERLPARFTVDIRLMRQVVSNLVSNAIKYSPDGSHVHVEAGARPDGGVEIAVHDQGVGIPADEQERLFERFFRASSSTGIAGTGIGLHMVKALVDMHGGQIEVSSEQDVGTTFTVSLPEGSDDGSARHTADQAA